MHTEKKLLQGMLDFAVECGHTPTRKEMDRHGPHSARTYKLRFENWNDAVKKAGLIPNRPGPGAPSPLPRWVERRLEDDQPVRVESAPIFPERPESGERVWWFKPGPDEWRPANIRRITGRRAVADFLDVWGRRCTIDTLSPMEHAAHLTGRWRDEATRRWTSYRDFHSMARFGERGAAPKLEDPCFECQALANAFDREMNLVGARTRARRPTKLQPDVLK